MIESGALTVIADGLDVIGRLPQRLEAPSGHGVPHVLVRPHLARRPLLRIHARHVRHVNVVRRAQLAPKPRESNLIRLKSFLEKW